MKIILSRKGFDTSNGKIPSPILHDGEKKTLLSLPIPSNENSLEDFEYNRKSYLKIITELTNGKFKGTHCHYDPDIRKMLSRMVCLWVGSPLLGKQKMHYQN